MSLVTDTLNDAINEPGCYIVDVRSAGELETDGNLGAMGVTNWANVPRDQISEAANLSDADFKV